jgi:Anthrone oxygenase
MLATTVDFADLLAAALIVGAMFAVWLIYNPAGVDAATYIAQQQHAIRGLNVALPVVGGVTVLLTILAAALARHDRTRLALLAIATALFIAGGLITRFANQPINATVMTWSPAAPPANWTKLRDAWWRWHLLRFAIGTGGLCLVIAAALSRDPSA